MVETLDYEVTVTWRPHHAIEFWKGDKNQCPYPEGYLQEADRIISHTHPRVLTTQDAPPSGRDLLNSADAVPDQRHWMYSVTGVWSYRPTPDLKRVVPLPGTADRERWERALLHNTARLLDQNPCTKLYCEKLEMLLPLSTSPGQRVGFHCMHVSWKDADGGDLAWPEVVLDMSRVQEALDRACVHTCALRLYV